MSGVGGVGVGDNVLNSNYTGGGNTAIGSGALRYTSTSTNTAVGYLSLGNAGKNNYSTGTASQSGTAISGSGTAWTSEMQGGTIVWSAAIAPLTTFVSTTSFTSAVSQTVVNGGYTIYYGTASSTGTVAQSGLNVTGTGTSFTASMIGGYLVYGTLQTSTATRITGVTSGTSLIVANSQTVAAGATYTIYYMAACTSNTAIGYQSGATLTSAGNNTLVGHNAGSAITTGSNNTIIGYNADVDNAARTGAVALGNGIIAIVDNGLFVKHRATTANTAAGFITGTNELVETTVPIGGVSAADYAYAYDTTSTQVITLANTWYDVTFDTNGSISLWTHVAGTANFTCATTGKYNVRATVTFNKSAANVESGIRLVIVTPGPVITEVVSSLQHYHMHTSATDHTVGVVELPVDITAGQILRVQVACDTGGSTVNLAAGTGFWATQPSARMQITRIA